mmetsp:Transcript_15889/g.39818  ORF Transcript_15889/g.39818 Transcript_15889/m.39818 type:complete len:361 (-) Transcript_15889:164-1246(-)
MSTCSSADVGRFDGRPAATSAGRRPLERMLTRSSSARRRWISALTVSMESSKKVSTSLRFCRMTVASRLMCPSSFVFRRTSWRSPAESSSASAIFLRSACASEPFSLSNSRTDVESERSKLFTLAFNSLISLDWRKPCLAYSFTDCSLSWTSRRNFLFSSSSVRLLFCNSSVSCTCSRSSSAILLFSNRIFLVDESRRSTASSCEVFFISASICLYSFCSLPFSSRNLRSIESNATLCSCSMSWRSCSPCSSFSSSTALRSLNSFRSRSSSSSSCSRFSRTAAALLTSSSAAARSAAAVSRSSSRCWTNISLCCAMVFLSESISSSFLSASRRRNEMICRASASCWSFSALREEFSVRRS